MTTGATTLATGSTTCVTTGTATFATGSITCVSTGATGATTLVSGATTGLTTGGGGAGSTGAGAGAGSASGSADAACSIVWPPAEVTPEIAPPRSPRLAARASLVPAKNETRHEEHRADPEEEERPNLPPPPRRFRHEVDIPCSPGH